jgi:hypothetical protein
VCQHRLFWKTREAVPYVPPATILKKEAFSCVPSSNFESRNAVFGVPTSKLLEHEEIPLSSRSVEDCTMKIIILLTRTDKGGRKETAFLPLR